MHEPYLGCYLLKFVTTGSALWDDHFELFFLLHYFGRKRLALGEC